jgi:hypothetical protein
MAASRAWKLTALVATVLSLLASVLVVTTTPAAALESIGKRGPSFSGASGSPSGSKPQSKLWYHDGDWWGVLFDTGSADFHIFRLNTATQTWQDTGVAVDDRTNTRSDVLWDGSRLYVASHVYSTSPAAGGPSRLYRYHYVPASHTWAADAGYPATINSLKLEALVIDKDSTGQLWATWVQGGQVWVNRSTTSDSAWGTPFAVPGSGGGLASDELASVIAFGTRIGVMWSDQTGNKMSFAVHRDGQPDATWDPVEVALSGPGMADDHINLKAAADGRVFATTKTSLTANSDPLIMLLVRSPTGVWSRHTVATESASHTRPIVLLDEGAQMVHVLATGPQPPSSSGQSGGDIYLKSSPMSGISFAAGVGTPVIRDGASADMNNVTSTKQPVSAATGLAAVATNDTTRFYWHNTVSLGTPPPTTTTAPPTTTTTTPPPGGGTFTFITPADAYVQSTLPNNNFKAAATLRARGGSPLYRSYVKFAVSGLTGSVTSARLRVFITDPSTTGGSARTTGNTWTEAGITYNNAPAPGAVLSSLGSVALNTWVEFDVTAAVTGNGTFSFAITSGSSNVVHYASRETANDPQLVVTTS